MPDGGCHGTKEWIDGLVTDSCPVMYVDENAALFRMYLWAERGFMPYRGGWAEQPAGVIAGLDILYKEAAEEQARQQKARERQARTQAQ